MYIYKKAERAIRDEKFSDEMTSGESLAGRAQVHSEGKEETKKRGKEGKQGR